MSPGGATGEARASRADPETLKGRQVFDARRHLRREVDVTIAYVKMLMQTEQVVFSSTDQCRKWITTHVKDHLLSRLRRVMRPEP
jgi:hypothetical protein